MRIFAIRDRLLDYFMTPFAAPESKAVMASLSNMINNPETADAIAQAPHHYEIWQLGVVNEDGHITAEQTLICDCASLVRERVRARAEIAPGNGALDAPEGRSRGEAGNPPLRTRTDQRAP